MSRAAHSSAAHSSAANFHGRIESPLGPLLVTATAAGLTGLYFDDHKYPPEPATLGESLDSGRRDAKFAELSALLNAYFSGDAVDFDFSVCPIGTEFQCQVWRQLTAIPHGQTRSYGDIARLIGKPNAARAVGAAIGRNPISIVVPCHRVVASSGALTGFSGGVDRKRFLLELERSTANPVSGTFGRALETAIRLDNRC